ncbi:MAG TPA: conjugal transfer protein TraU, partial [Piscirickettsiaceae bacterium]|nr:conjugal transfer protein TraU [Piscirickettsiaceae bacterium]
LSISLSFAKCKVSPTNIVNAIFSVDYSAMLPLKIAGIPILPGRMPDVFNSVNQPICICPAPPPIMVRIGIPVGFFNPDRMIDSVKDSYCFVGLGLDLGMSGNNGTQANDPLSGEHTFFQTHMMMFSPFGLLQIATDFICLQDPHPIDIGYMTELDPMWNDDMLSALIQPEALLFGNPVTNLACIADSISAQSDKSIPTLFWCKGSWGNAYPLTGRVTSNDYVQSAASAAAGLIYKLHRELIFWGTWGHAGLCQKYPAPIWQKDAYRMQILFPIAHKMAIAIGKTGLVWSFLKNIPFKGDNFSFVIFRKKDCCDF